MTKSNKPKGPLNEGVEGHGAVVIPPRPQSGALRAQAESFLFVPSEPMERAKARFWTNFIPGPLSSGDSRGITLEMVLATTRIPGIQTWWRDAQFRDWFLNQEEEREKIRFLFNRGLDALADLLASPLAGAGAKIQAIKLLAEMTGHINNKNKQDRFADEEINKWGQNELEAYLTKKGVKLVTEVAIEAESSDAGTQGIPSEGSPRNR